MIESDLSSSDSDRVFGGRIPGDVSNPAFSLRASQPSAIPVLIAVPHAGRSYPGSLLERMRNPGIATLRLEDRYVDVLGERVARATGASLLIAHAPRAMIDLNRATDEVDWEMFAPGRPDHPGSPVSGIRARSGLGLIPRRLPGLGELWNRRHEEEELTERIDAIHEPYHVCLSQALGALRARWGAALLIDLHSMPPLGLRGPQPPPEFVIGDRFGVSCNGQLVAASFAYFNERRRTIAHNRPYAGGYVLDRHASPGDGRHALQLEIDRSTYLNQRLTEPGPGFDGTVELLTGLVGRLAVAVAAMTGTGGEDGWAEAAE